MPDKDSSDELQPPADSPKSDDTSAEVTPKQSAPETVAVGDDFGSTVDVKPDSVPDEVVSWEASEYVHSQKGATWYIWFGSGYVLLIAVVYLLLRDIFSIIVLLVMGVAIGAYAGREPRVLKYVIDHHNLKINEKTYSFDDFSTFSISREGGIFNLTLMPLKRFMPTLSIYFAPDDHDQIVNILGSILPYEERRPDLIDSISKRLRF